VCERENPATGGRVGKRKYPAHITATVGKGRPSGYRTNATQQLRGEKKRKLERGQ